MTIILFQYLVGH